jgi:hypothetical protein
MKTFSTKIGLSIFPAENTEASHIAEAIQMSNSTAIPISPLKSKR